MPASPATATLRQAAFKGLREDKPAAEVEAETPAPASTTQLKEPAPTTVRTKTVSPRGSTPVMGVTISHADKPLWPDADDGKPVTKLELAQYYEAIGEWMLPHVEGPAVLDDPHAGRHQRRAELLPAACRQGPVVADHRG